MIYRICVNDWRVWTAPLKTNAWWYSEDYFEETMKAFNQASGGLQIIFMIMPGKNKSQNVVKRSQND